MKNTKYINTDTLISEEKRLIKLVDRLAKYKHFGRDQRADARNALSCVQAELNRRDAAHIVNILANIEPPQNETIYNRRMKDGSYRPICEFFNNAAK